MNTGRLWFLALVAAMGGFLFGYDTAVINGAEQQIQSVFGLSSSMHGLVMSAALWGTVLGALLGGRLSDRIGRKTTLLLVGVFYLVSAVWSALASGPVILIVARFVGGLAVGCSSNAAPVYIAEISPDKSRGLMTAIFQLDVVLGMVCSQFVNVAIGSGTVNSWRWMLGAEAVPALLFTVLCPFLVESPRYLAERESIRAAARTSSGLREKFWTRKNRRPILLAIAVAVFNQLSGINAINYFMPRIFSMAGFSQETSLSLTAMAGVFLAAGTVIGMFLIDRIGRRTLLIVGGSGYVLSLFTLALAFLQGKGTLATVCIVVFMLSHSIGQGTVIWVLISEIFPTRIRGIGQSVGAFTHWMFAAIITFAFPVAASKTGPAVIFICFGAFMVLHLLWAIFIVPETKGKSLEEIDECL